VTAAAPLVAGIRAVRKAFPALTLSVAIMLVGVGASSSSGARLIRVPSRPAINADARLPRSIPSIDTATALIAEGQDALRQNLGRPLLAGGLELQPAFAIENGSAATFSRAQECLALAMYYEAGFEGHGGRMAVGQVVLNRVRHPAFPHEVCAVVFQRSTTRVCQFTFACDGAMNRPKVPALWRQANVEAAELLAGKTYAPVGMATHYHANYVLPSWAPNLDKIATIGAHIFYRWHGDWGLRRSFYARYAGTESELPPGQMPTVDEPVSATGPAGVASSDPPPRRSQNEGGFVDPAIGWVPRISAPVVETARSEVGT